MKNIIVIAIALLIASPMSARAEPLDRTREYRMWSADQIINRFTDKFRRPIAICNQDHIPEVCKGAIIGAYPILDTVRKIAATGDDVQWAKIVDAVHEVESEHK